MPRATSPPSGSSTLITSAPMLAICIVQYGPMKVVVRSTTRRPSRGAAVIQTLPQIAEPRDLVEDNKAILAHDPYRLLAEIHLRLIRTGRVKRTMPSDTEARWCRDPLPCPKPT